MSKLVEDTPGKKANSFHVYRATRTISHIRRDFTFAYVQIVNQTEYETSVNRDVVNMWTEVN
jgi:hypothetical protein